MSNTMLIILSLAAILALLAAGVRFLDASANLDPKYGRDYAKGLPAAAWGFLFTAWFAYLVVLIAADRGLMTGGLVAGSGIGIIVALIALLRWDIRRIG